MNQEPSQLLRLAEQHAAKLPEVLEGLPKDDVSSSIDHAIQAIVLAAASVESAVNIAMAEPLCCVEPLPARRFYAQMFQLASRSSIRKKCAFLLRNRHGLSITKNEKKELAALFDARNAILHSTPEYREYPVTDDNTRGMSPEMVAACGPVMSVLRTGVRSTDILGTATKACDIARRFLDKLKTSVPWDPTDGQPAASEEQGCEEEA